MILEAGSEKQAELAGAWRGSPSGATHPPWVLRRVQPPACPHLVLQPSLSVTGGTLPAIKGAAPERAACKSPQGLPACWERKYQNCLEIKQQSRNRGKKRNDRKMKPKLTPFVTENIQYGESSPPSAGRSGDNTLSHHPSRFQRHAMEIQGDSDPRAASPATASHHRRPETMTATALRLQVSGDKLQGVQMQRA